jgi:rsbT co-antagonist protein RsbR
MEEEGRTSDGATGGEPGSVAGVTFTEEFAALRAEVERLRRIEARHALLERSTTLLVVSVDPAGRFIHVNDHYCETFGKSREELIGHTFAPLVHEEDLPATLLAMKQLEVPPYSVRLEQRALTPRGFEWFVWEDWAVFDEAGRTVEIQGIGQNITRFKEMAAERESLQAQVIAAQRAALLEMSTPLVPIAEGVVAMPLVGALDRERGQRALEALLEGVTQAGARTAIVDITGIKAVDAEAVAALVQAAQAVRLLGAEVVLTGIGPAVAQTLVELGGDLGGLVTRGTLQAGIAHALRRARSSY